MDIAWPGVLTHFTELRDTLDNKGGTIHVVKALHRMDTLTDACSTYIC